MIQSVQLQRARTPVLALGALALVALGATVLPHVGGSAAPETSIVRGKPLTFEQRALIVQAPADSTACGAGAYVSGDVAGDASPAAIYATMCGRSR